MSPSRPRLPSLEVDVVGVAAAAALVSGALSIVGPYLLALPGALAALAFAGWVAQLRRTAGAAPVRLPPGSASALAVLGAGSVGYLLAAPWLGRTRGLVLALALLPLWNLTRRSSGAVP